MLTHVIWDFNGTLFDDIDASIRSANKILARMNKQEIQDVSDYYAKFTFPIEEYYKRLGLDLTPEEFRAIGREWTENYTVLSGESRLFPGTAETLQLIKSKGIKQIILTASERKMVTRQLTGLGIKDYFSDILALSENLGGSKAQIALDWLSTVKDPRLLMIGDTWHDYEVAELLGADCILKRGGHQDLDSLSGSFTVTESMKELSYIISKNY